MKIYNEQIALQSQKPRWRKAVSATVLSWFQRCIRLDLGPRQFVQFVELDRLCPKRLLIKVFR